MDEGLNKKMRGNASHFFCCYFTLIFCPILSTLFARMPFSRQMLFTVVPYFLAILPKVSPCLTV